MSSPYINRFLQPDTIIPDLSNPQSWNHFSYALNNPIKFTDPSGHCSGNPNDSQNPDASCWQMIDAISSNYEFITIDSNQWTTQELKVVDKALGAMQNSFGGNDKMRDAIGNVTLKRRDKYYQDYLVKDKITTAVSNPLTRSITAYDYGMNTVEPNSVFTVLHEFGHIYDFNNGLPSGKFAKEFWPECIYVIKYCPFGGRPKDETVTDYGKASPSEDFADTFAITIFDENFDHSIQMSMPEYPPGMLPLPGDVRMPSEMRFTFMRKLLDD